MNITCPEHPEVVMTVCYSTGVCFLYYCYLCKTNYEAIIWKGECLSVLSKKRLGRNKDGKRKIYYKEIGDNIK